VWIVGLASLIRYCAVFHDHRGVERMTDTET
jgi:hypothetical protein